MMKTNKEQIYNFLTLHCQEGENTGVSTQYLAQMLGVQRTNVSAILNSLVAEGRVGKRNGRPVLYYVPREDENGGGHCFENLVGHRGSLRRAVQLAQAAVLYPEKRLNTMITGQQGTGKKYLAMLAHKFGVESGKIASDAAYLTVDCKEYTDDEERLLGELFGEDGQGGIFAKAQHGVLVIGGVHHISARVRSQICARIETEDDSKSGVQALVLCDLTRAPCDEFRRRLPIIIELPPLRERPLEERLELIQNFLTLEAARAKRTISINAEVMRCLLLYETEANVLQLKLDIKAACANAYVREHHGKDGKLNLYLSDFGNYVRKGFLNYSANRGEIERIIPTDYGYLFNEKTMEMTALDRTKAKDAAIYENIDRRVREFAERGMSDADITTLLMAELEAMFSAYQIEMNRQNINAEQVSRIVDERVIRLVNAFLGDAGVKLGRGLSQSVFCGLCLHLDALLKQTRRQTTLSPKQIREVVENYMAEYTLCMQFAAALEQELRIRLSIDEIVFITMFICFQGGGGNLAPRPAMLFILRGEGLGQALAASINAMGGLQNVSWFEVPPGQDIAQFYADLKACVERSDRGRGVLAYVEDEALSAVLSTIIHETGIEIRTVPFPLVELCFSMAREAAAEEDIDTAHRNILRLMEAFVKPKPKVIVTLCSTGEGGAQELKRYIERQGGAEGMKVVPLAFSDRERLREELLALGERAMVHCVVGPHDPKLFGIPFVSIAQVFEAPPERLPDLLELRRRDKERERSRSNFDAVYDYLSEHLERVDIGRLKRALPQAIEDINASILEMPFDTEVGLFLHIACNIERLLSGGQTPPHVQREQLLQKYAKAYKELRRILRPVEKAFKIILNDDELAYLITILFRV